MEKDIHIIDNYRNLPLGDHVEIVKIDKDQSLEEIDKRVKIMSILTGKSEDFLLDLPINEFKSLSAKMKFLEKELPEDVLRHADSYQVGKFTLVPVTDIRKITTAQYIDFISFHKAGHDEHIAEILSCLLVPKGKKYNQDYDIMEVQEALRKDMSVYDAACLYAFFLASCSTSIVDILTYSRKEAMKVKDKEKREKMLQEIQRLQTLMRNGDGSPMLMQ